MSKRITRAKAIRLKCLDCCCNQYAEIRLCEIKECPLWRFRMGKEEKDESYYRTHQEQNISGSGEKTA
jgi:hypothetical protein